MGDRAKTPAGAAGRAPTADRPSDIRNVVLVGHSGSGKTTLVEALAQTAGALNRAGRVEDGGTVSDHDEIEQRRHRSVQLSLVPVGWDGYKVNLIDTPGYADFVGELRPVCARRTRPSSSSRPPRRPTPSPPPRARSGRSAPPSACPAPSSSPTSTPPAPASRS